MIITTIGRRGLLRVAASLALAVAIPVTASAHNDRQRGRLSGRAREKAANVANGNTKLDILVRFRQPPGHAERDSVKRLGGSVRRSLRSQSRWMSLRVPAHRLAALADDPRIEYVGLDEPVSTAMDVARQAANMPAAPAPETSLTGLGVTVAIVDSGVALHPDMQALTTVVDFVEHNNPAPAPAEDSIDPNGHGTHVAGIVAGNGSLSGGLHTGIAPAANLISVRVLDGLGRGASSDVLGGLQWILANHAERGIRVVNLSLGHPVYEPAEDDPLVEAVEALWDAGVVVVCSAGNRGRSGWITITSPCNSRKVITVGASNDSGTADTGDDKVATYSSRGPTAFDLFAKPDLVAPGNRIVSLRVPGSHFDTILPDRRVAADPAFPEVVDYYEMSGTSMAAPIVAGTAALMLEQDPTLTPATIKARLMMSALKPRFGDPMLSGAGLLDIVEALRGTWTAPASPSPRATADEANGLIAFENTSILWGDDVFSLRHLWANSVSWTNPEATLDPILWTSGEVWPEGVTEGQGELWPNGECWPEGEMWPDAPLWQPALTTPEVAGPVETEALASGFRDE
jgi:serine protease AprX